MFNLLFMLSRLVLVPYDLLSAPFRFFGGIMQDSGRGRAMVLGLPAVIVSLMGIGLISWANWGDKDRLISVYNARAEKAGDAKARLLTEINNEKRLQSGRQRQNGQVTLEKDDPRLEELKQFHQEEQIYLEKLIDLDPLEPDFRFRLALIAYQMNDVKRCLSLMNSIAPEDEPGYAKAHLWMSKSYLSRRAKTANDLRKALTHAEHCLVRDNGNLEAKLLKAQLLTNEKRYVEAYNMYEDLFAEYPRFYRQLVELNNLMGGENLDKNSIVLDKAQLRFQEAVNKAASDGEYAPNWARAWVNLVGCLRDKNEYQIAIDKLTAEESKQRKLAETEATPEAASRHVHIKQLLTEFYTRWAGVLGADPDNDIAKQLDLLKRAMSFDPKNARALQLIARISSGDSEYAEAAKEIYNPETHEDAPATVLNEMGSRALKKEEYDKAIKYFELARRKTPNDPQILNNLAFTYLVCENKNPDRALTLVNQALLAIQRLGNSRDRLILLSHFNDTRGRALMQMNRMDEAAAALEIAMQIRPKEKEILLALIECYEGRDQKQAEVYRRRLKQIESETSEAGGQ